METVTFTFYRILIDVLPDIIKQDFDAQINWSREDSPAIRLFEWLGENTSHTRYNADGANVIEVPKDLAYSFICFVAVSYYKTKNKYFNILGSALNPELYQMVQEEMQTLTAEDRRN